MTELNFVKNNFFGPWRWEVTSIKIAYPDSSGGSKFAFCVDSYCGFVAFPSSYISPNLFSLYWSSDKQFFIKIQL